MNKDKCNTAMSDLANFDATISPELDRRTIQGQLKSFLQNISTRLKLIEF